jgi:tetratricopeptide (TPR) repeat protein
MPTIRNAGAKLKCMNGWFTSDSEPVASKKKFARDGLKRYSLQSGIWILLFASFGIAAEEVWTEVTSPNFIVISNASPKQTRSAAKSFEQFRGLIKSCLPTVSVDPGTPLTVFAAKDERSFKALIAEEHQERNESQKAGVFTAGPERNFVALRIDLPPEQGYHVIYHEYVHMLMRLNLGEIPLWLNEGLAEFFGYATVSDNKSTIGTPGPQSLQILKTRSMVPLSTLFSAAKDSPYYWEKDKTPIFYAQSWALTHYLMVGDKRAHAKQLNDYLILLKKGISGKEAAAQAFGDIRALEQSLRNYTSSLAFYSLQYSGEIESVHEDLYQSRTLTPAESMASRGELLVYMNKPDRAKAVLEGSLQMDSSSARANEALGLLYSSLGDRGQAEKFFSSAAELDSNSYLAQFYAAQSKLQNGSVDDLSSAEKQLRKALAINARFAPAYRQLSYVLQRQAKLSEALEMAEKAALLEPGVLSHSLNAAGIMAAMGKIDEAHARAQQVLALARTEPDRLQAESLVNRIKSFQEQRMSSQGIAGRQYQEPRMRSGQKQQVAKIEEERLRSLDEMESKRKAAAASRANMKTGAPAKLSGTIRSVKCDYPATLDFVLESKGRQDKLHAENYYQVQYGAVAGAGRTDFEPCSELEGKEVEIDILTVSGQEFSGLIKSVTIVK